MRVTFDAVGAVMGFLTIPMALLSAASIAAGGLLALHAVWVPLLFGALLFGLCAAAARPLEWLIIGIDDRADMAMRCGRRGRARLIAVASGAAPIAIILALEVASLHAMLSCRGVAPAPLVWLWGYGIATGPWTLFAEQVGRFRRTLVAIRAYAGHVALWLFSLLALVLHAPIAVAVMAMLVPAALPFTVGLLLALADREAIANVRV